MSMLKPTDSVRPLGRIRVRLESFRAFADSGQFTLAPLTCLVGANSTGKSSIISALLLLKQSLEQEFVSSRVTPLALVGPYCDLGNYADVVHDHNEAAELSFSFSIPLADLRTEFLGRPLVNLRVPRSSFSYRVVYYQRPADASLPEHGDIMTRLSFSTDQPFGPSLSRVEIAIDGVGKGRFVRTTKGVRRQHWRFYTDDLPSKAVELRLVPRAFFPIVERRERSYVRAAPKTKQRINRFVDATRQMFLYLQRTLLLSEFIGPFRTRPERRYAFGGFSSSKSGQTGEQAVDLLISESLTKPAGARELGSTVSYWVKHLRLARSLSIADIAKRLNLFEVKVSGAGAAAKANLADVGFGISQVLPVIVQGLLMRPGGIYFVQQPEIHLHPDAQAGLADFFISLAVNGVRVVVETHSEYLLIRLRRRLAEAKGGGEVVGPPSLRPGARLSSASVAVLLTSSAATGSVVTELQIGDSFQFENLPQGFMSQAIDDRMELLKAVAKSNA